MLLTLLSLTVPGFAQDCPADLDGDLGIDSVDLSLLLADWGTSGAGDLNDDGQVDGQDLSELLATWGPCPESDWRCGEPLVDERDGRAYSTRLYGVTCWMTENLNVGEYIESVGAGSQAKDDGIVQKFCYGNDVEACDVWGGLYSWDEVVDHTAGSDSVPSGVRGVCPTGWHVPSDDEFKVLEWTLGMSEKETEIVDGWRGSPVGTEMKVGGSSDFDGMLGGWRSAEDGSFNDQDFYGGWWSASPGWDDPNGEAMNRGLLAPLPTVGRYGYDLRTALSIRCVGDVLEDD